MNRDEIIDAIFQLPTCDRRQLLREVREGRRRRHVVPEDALARTCLQAAGEVLGIDTGYASRQREQSLARQLVTKTLLDHGYKPSQVTAALDTERTAVYYYRRKLEDWPRYPAAFAEELRLLEQYEQTLKKYGI